MFINPCWLLIHHSASTVPIVLLHSTFTVNIWVIPLHSLLNSLFFPFQLSFISFLIPPQPRFSYPVVSHSNNFPWILLLLFFPLTSDNLQHFTPRLTYKLICLHELSSKRLQHWTNQCCPHVSAVNRNDFVSYLFPGLFVSWKLPWATQSTKNWLIIHRFWMSWNCIDFLIDCCRVKKDQGYPQWFRENT